MRQFKSQAEAEAAGVYVSKVKSYVKREGRLTKGQEKALADYWPTMGIDYADAPLSLSDVFGRTAPVVVEIGFGMGKSLVEMAAASPDKDFIGIEVHRPGVGACLSDAGDQGVENLRVMEHDAVEVLKNMIPDGSLSRLQLFFPDPWHKKRHHKRRIVQSEFAELVRTKLAIGGCFHMATDWEAYAEHMAEVMNNAPGYTNTAEEGDYVPRPEYRPITKFETRGQKLGHGVWDLIYERTK
ncbi:tRNA (guanosine(46)-N7)-methyltransferase TrmB [Alteromonas sp. McT4-15]|jgi:tRNA (guanine-N7-)-methyltransferase|uniref:tRNA (guanosine(46)-N7)-methyltransferase TrmB n=1 Tax=unclassified Alteromonas TaxID=2614992 RepID=UPI001920510B|nr:MULTISPECIES: tRNA (guanosine(46)-N7)-methyltransferase TrmB [unclassified Alteromonas]MCB4437879.1 tRNA (guanosine(46)-N7)-methyltransferase TrmB [Alteromonas sp. McT4-15]BCO17396.1 tRNA (guanine-N(7)-)-methyltransferase [Alteromonas sp. KC3]BCO21386.1 tRNA (guanine-N(7)-)-methyltransferase [Alteromonas sp. KC14]